MTENEAGDQPERPEQHPLGVSLTHPASGTVLLTLTGEIDATTASQLTAVLDEALTAQPGVLVLDLTGIVFCGSVGLAALIHTHQRCGTTTSMRIVPGSLLSKLHTTGLADHLPLYPDLHTALTEAHPPA